MSDRLTLSVPAPVVTAAKIKALTEGTTLSAEVTGWLEGWAQDGTVPAAADTAPPGYQDEWRALATANDSLRNTLSATAAALGLRPEQYAPSYDGFPGAAGELSENATALLAENTAQRHQIAGLESELATLRSQARRWREGDAAAGAAMMYRLAQPSAAPEAFSRTGWKDTAADLASQYIMEEIAPPPITRPAPAEPGCHGEGALAAPPAATATVDAVDAVALADVTVPAGDVPQIAALAPKALAPSTVRAEDHPFHAPDGPASCHRCQLLRETRGWMEAGGGPLLLLADETTGEEPA